MDSQEHRDWRNVPVYNLSLAHARKKGEEETFRASSEANNLCSKRIREALDSQRQGSIPMKECLLSLIRDFGWERVLYLLANSIQIAQGDLRISPDNTKWANEYRITPNLPKNEIDWRYLWDIRISPSIPCSTIKIQDNSTLFYGMNVLVYVQNPYQQDQNQE